MKSLTKKALSLAMAIAMAGSCMAFASTVTIGEVTEDGTSVSIPYETTETDQVTVIVYEVADENDATAPANDTIGYINQIDAPEDGSDTITFTMRDDFVAEGAIANGVYKIIMGGTGVGEADVAYLVVKDEVITITVGDADGNGVIEPADAAEVIAHYLGTKVLTGANLTAADVDKNGTVEPADAAEIIAVYLGTKTLD